MGGGTKRIPTSEDDVENFFPVIRTLLGALAPRAVPIFRRAGELRRCEYLYALLNALPGA